MYCIWSHVISLPSIHAPAFDSTYRDWPPRIECKQFCNVPHTIIHAPLTMDAWGILQLKNIVVILVVKFAITGFLV